MSDSNLILTYATENVTNEHTFRYFWKSVLDKCPGTDIAILSHDLPEHTIFSALSKDRISINKFDPKKMNDLMRDRHLAFWEHLTFGQADEYDLIMLSDCRDVVFQSDPFEWARNQAWLPKEFVMFVSEGFTTSQSGFACIEHFEFQRDVPLPFMRDIGNQGVFNGGTILGTRQAMQDFLLLMWTMSMKTMGRCTDQATLNWLIGYLVYDIKYKFINPQQYSFCLTGEGAKQNAVSYTIDSDGVKHPNGEKFAVLHQWDRVPELKEAVLSLKY